MGQNGRKNCLVRGIATEATIAAKIPALTTRLAGMIESEKRTRMVSIRYCTSSKDKRCALSERRLSRGEIDVWREAKVEEGDCLLRILDRNFRRMR